MALWGLIWSLLGGIPIFSESGGIMLLEGVTSAVFFLHFDTRILTYNFSQLKFVVYSNSLMLPMTTVLTWELLLVSCQSGNYTCNNSAFQHLGTGCLSQSRRHASISEYPPSFWNPESKGHRTPLPDLSLVWPHLPSGHPWVNVCVSYATILAEAAILPKQPPNSQMQKWEWITRQPSSAHESSWP